MEAMTYIGNRLRELRMAKVLRQDELAEMSGLGVATVVRIENNKVEPHVTTIRKLAKALGVEPAELVKRD